MSLEVRFFPDIEGLVANPYWSILRSSLEARNIRVSSDKTMFGGRWLKNNSSAFDVLHFHYIQGFYGYEREFARLRWVLRFARNLVIARNLGYRTVFTLHNLRPTYGLKPGWVDYLGHWVAANLTNSVIVHCEYARSKLAERYKRKKHVYNVAHPHLIGIYEDTISRTEARKRLGMQNGHRIFLFFGGIRPNKGLDQLISAFREIADDDARLIIAGKPWPPDSYLARIRDLAAPDTRITIDAHLIADDQVQVYFRAADIVVLPFKRILTSSSTILALSFGRPVIVPDIGCLTELVGNEVGIRYDAEDASALARALQLSVNMDLEKMGINAQKSVEASSWDAFAAETEAAYWGQ